MQVKFETEENHLLGGRVIITQPRRGFRASSDTVLLSAAVKTKLITTGTRLLDLGCGVGSAGFCVLKRFDHHTDLHLTGVDIQPDLITLAQKNAVLNDLAGRCHFLQGDVTDKNIALPDNHFDIIIANPPFHEEGQNMPSDNIIKSIAHGHDALSATWEDWVYCANRKCKPGGSFIVIHRADRLPDILGKLAPWFGSVTIIPLWPKKNEPAKRFIFMARKQRFAPAVLNQGHILHEDNGEHTADTMAILKGERPLII
jgi:tRNA1(Val) A37 N6-methylase TrmN6